MLLTIGIALLLAQDVEIRPRIQAGDEFRLEVIRARENTSRPQGNGSSRTLVDVRVISTMPTGFVVDWTPGTTTFDNPLQAQDPAVMAASKAVQQIRFRLNLNADGELTGLANEAEVSVKMQSMASALIQELSATLPQAQRATFQAAVKQVFTPALLISSATRDAQAYFGLNGAALAPGETVEVPIEQPSPLGGGVIPATFAVKMDSATAESASLTTKTTYDAEALRKATIAMLQQQTGGAIPTAELAKMPVMQMSDDGKYVFDIPLGLMREVTINRRIVSGNERRLDGWIIRLVATSRR